MALAMVLFLSILSTSALELIPQYSDFSGFIQPGIGYLSFEINWRYIFVLVAGHRSQKIHGKPYHGLQALNLRR